MFEEYFKYASELTEQERFNDWYDKKSQDMNGRDTIKFLSWETLNCQRVLGALLTHLKLDGKQLCENIEKEAESLTPRGAS